MNEKRTLRIYGEREAGSGKGFVAEKREEEKRQFFLYSLFSAFLFVATCSRSTEARPSKRDKKTPEIKENAGNQKKTSEINGKQPKKKTAVRLTRNSEHMPENLFDKRFVVIGYANNGRWRSGCTAASRNQDGPTD